MLLLKKEELKSHQDTSCYICGKRILKKLSKTINYHKYRAAPCSICKLKFNVSNEIPEVFHNGSDYNYHFIIKEIANWFAGKFECLGENTEKPKDFSIPIEKEIIKIDKYGNEIVITTSCKTKFIDSARFMAMYDQILLIISHKEFTKLNVKIAFDFLNMKVSNKIQ